MLANIFTNRLFIGALAFFVLCVGGSLLYMQHVNRQGAEYQKETDARVRQWNEKQTEQGAAKAPVGEQPTAEVGHFHEDGTWHAGAHEPIAAPPKVSNTEVSREVSREVSTAPQMEYDKGAGNPPPFDKVPVDLWDFEATKAVMIENINFVKANWDPKVNNPDVRIANTIAHNIANAAVATQLGLFTPEQALELNTLYSDLLAFKGIDGSRVDELYRQGHTVDEAYRISTEETLQRQGVK